MAQTPPRGPLPQEEAACPLAFQASTIPFNNNNKIRCVGTPADSSAHPKDHANGCGMSGHFARGSTGSTMPTTAPVGSYTSFSELQVEEIKLDQEEQHYWDMFCDMIERSVMTKRAKPRRKSSYPEWVASDFQEPVPVRAKRKRVPIRLGDRSKDIVLCEGSDYLTITEEVASLFNIPVTKLSTLGLRLAGVPLRDHFVWGRLDLAGIKEGDGLTVIPLGPGGNKPRNFVERRTHSEMLHGREHNYHPTGFSCIVPSKQKCWEMRDERPLATNSPVKRETVPDPDSVEVGIVLGSRRVDVRLESSYTFDEMHDIVGAICGMKKEQAFYFSIDGTICCDDVELEGGERIDVYLSIVGGKKGKEISKSTVKQVAKEVAREAAQKVRSARLNRKGKNTGRDIGRIVGGALASAIGVPELGAGIGGALGKKAGSGIMRIFGHGDYELMPNPSPDHTSGPAPTVNSLFRGAAPRGGMKFGDGGRVLHYPTREFIGQVVLPAPGETTLNVRNINPGLFTTCPRTQSMANQFEQYSLDGAVFEFESLFGELSTVGTQPEVMMTTQHNVTATEFTSKFELLNSNFAVSDKASRHIDYPCECAEFAQKAYYTRSGKSDTPANLTDVFKLYIGVVNNTTLPAGTVIGNLWGTYDLKFSQPKVTPQSNGYVRVSGFNTTSLSPNNVLTNATIASTVASGAFSSAYIDSGGSLVFPPLPKGAAVLVTYQETTQTNDAGILVPLTWTSSSTMEPQDIYNSDGNPASTEAQGFSLSPEGISSSESGYNNSTLCTFLSATEDVSSWSFSVQNTTFTTVGTLYGFTFVIVLVALAELSEN